MPKSSYCRFYSDATSEWNLLFWAVTTIWPYCKIKSHQLQINHEENSVSIFHLSTYLCLCLQTLYQITTSNCLLCCHHLSRGIPLGSCPSPLSTLCRISILCTKRIFNLRNPRCLFRGSKPDICWDLPPWKSWELSPFLTANEESFPEVF